VWKEKTSTDLIEQEDNEAMEMGRRLESVVAQAYAERTGDLVRRDHKIRVHPTTPFMRCNLDRVIWGRGNGIGPGILEIKTTSSFYAKTWKEAIPIEHFVQVQHQFYVTGFLWGVIVILIDGRKLQMFEIKPDEDQIERQNRILFEFWSDNVCTKLAPASTVRDYELVTSKPEAIVEADVTSVELVTELKQLVERRRRFEHTEKTIQDALKLRMGEAEILSSEGRILATWKTIKRTTIDLKAMKARIPEVCTIYMTEKQSRQFIIKREEE